MDSIKIEGNERTREMSSGKKEILFEKFEIKECLKKDQYASVFIAFHIYLGKDIILKSLKLSEGLDKSIADRFKREAKILAKLDHPNIIKVLDFGTSENHFYISFEYFKGKNLREVINKRELNNDQKVHLTKQLLSGLHHSHKLEVIHRDIKPENIFINDNLDLKLGDFGLATSITENFVTEQNSIVGTPSYMSPEQIAGEELNFSTDLFSSGIVLFELYHNENPFLGKDINETIGRLLTYSESETIKKINTGIPEIDELLIKMLKKSPNERLKSAEEGLRLLGSVPAENISNKKTTRKEKQIVGVFTIAAVIIVVLIFIPTKLDDESPDFSVNDSLLPANQITSINDSIIIEKDSDADNLMEKNVVSNSDLNEQIIEEAPINYIDQKAAEEVKYGELFIECTPWADVYLDSILVDTTPLAKNIRIKAGSYKLMLIHPEFPQYESGIVIDENLVRNIKVNLNELLGEIEFNVFPWANVFVNKKFIGETPLPEPIKVMPGKIIITLENPEYKTVDTTLFLSGGEKKRFNFKLEQRDE